MIYLSYIPTKRMMHLVVNEYYVRWPTWFDIRIPGLVEQINYMATSGNTSFIMSSNSFNVRAHFYPGAYHGHQGQFCLEGPNGQQDGSSYYCFLDAWMCVGNPTNSYTLWAATGAEVIK